MEDSGYKDVRSVLEYVAGVDVYSDGQEVKNFNIHERN